MKRLFFYSLLLISILFFQRPLFAQYSLPDDLDQDGKSDSIIYYPNRSQVLVRLSSRNFHSIKSKDSLAAGAVAGLKSTDEGFRLYLISDRLESNLYFQYEESSGKIRLTKMTQQGVGPQASDHFGNAQLNFLTGNFLGQWQFYDEGKRRLIKLPKTEEPISRTPIYLEEVGRYQLMAFSERNADLFTKKKQDFLENNSLTEKPEIRQKTIEYKNKSVWKGSLSGREALLIVQRYDQIQLAKAKSFIVGTLSFLGNNLQERLVGSVDINGNYELKSYDENHQVARLLKGTMNGHTFRGSILSLKSKEESDFTLAKNDIDVPSMNVFTAIDRLPGRYKYQSIDEKKAFAELIVKAKDDDGITILLSFTDREGHSHQLLEESGIQMSQPSVTLGVPGGEFEVNLRFFKDIILMDSEILPHEDTKVFYRTEDEW